MADGRKDRHLSALVRVKAETMARIDALQEQTRLQKSEIASMLIDYALEHVKLVPAECWDIDFE